MRITLLGHASLLVELEGAACLMDPVFDDPFEEGTVVSCPRRSVSVAKLPPIDLLVVSHRHPDHFDIASLARVPRDCDAICPADPLIVHALRALGFPRVTPVHTMGPILSAAFELYPTRSESPVREMGMVFRDRTGTLFNQVDSPLSNETIDALRARFGRIDVAFAMFASQNFDFFESRTTTFPFEEHRRNLESVRRLAPGVVVPGSAGFRFSGDRAWLNAFLFPISRERFVADLHRLDPSLTTRMVNPGDVLELAGGEVVHRRGASEVARTEEDDTHLLRFDPAGSIPPLTDPNPDGLEPDQCVRATDAFVDALAGWVRATWESGDPVVGLHRDARATYGIEVVLGGAPSRWHRLDFGGAHLEVDRGRGPVAHETSIVHRIAASPLLGWLAREKTFYYVRSYSRRHSDLYDLACESDGAVRMVTRTLPDLLMYYLLEQADGANVAALRHVEIEIGRARAAGAICT